MPQHTRQTDAGGGHLASFAPNEVVIPATDTRKPIYKLLFDGPLAAAAGPHPPAQQPAAVAAAAAAHHPAGAAASAAGGSHTALQASLSPSPSSVEAATAAGAAATVAGAESPSAAISGGVLIAGGIDGSSSSTSSESLPAAAAAAVAQHDQGSQLGQSQGNHQGNHHAPPGGVRDQHQHHHVDRARATEVMGHGEGLDWRAAGGMGPASHSQWAQQQHQQHQQQHQQQQLWQGQSPSSSLSPSFIDSHGGFGASDHQPAAVQQTPQTPQTQQQPAIPVDLIPSLIQHSKSPADSHDYWRLFTKAKDALPNGARLENLSWRLFHMKLSKERERTEGPLRLPGMDGDSADTSAMRTAMDTAMDTATMFDASAAATFEAGRLPPRPTPAAAHRSGSTAASTSSATFAGTGAGRGTAAIRPGPRAAGTGAAKSGEQSKTNIFGLPIAGDAGSATGVMGATGATGAALPSMGHHQAGPDGMAQMPAEAALIGQQGSGLYAAEATAATAAAGVSHPFSVSDTAHWGLSGGALWDACGAMGCDVERWDAMAELGPEQLGRCFDFTCVCERV
ncbi:hypothetical protein BC831DRAFT_487716 [Entophlyctis helioformis]|nr:hypothetical protein BC831DRAFT_487716 [Entophlyctis helioformis]